ncbi:MAG: D-lyxose/D-mannose family sugar isomerase [bacterium]|nr:D-lyxose/D-mannose family sugar isomerase [bacterium]
MKRSEINNAIKKAIKLFNEINFKLPPYAYWTPNEWSLKGMEVDEIKENMLGWNVTDFCNGDFSRCGLMDFTIRNGNYNKPEKYAKRYAEKIMMTGEEQVTPMHFHWKKCEDIINRGGGNLVIELYKSTDDERLSRDEFSVKIDGVEKHCKPGETVILTPGESICLEPYIYHTFYGEKGKGIVAVGEVSDVNDDKTDNRFLNPIGRFAEIEEDEKPIYLLCNEYPE